VKTFNLKFRFLVLIVLIFPLLTGPNVSAAPSVMKIAQVDVETTASKGLDYLANQMNQDGGIRWFDESSSVAATLRVINALAAAGYPQDYLTSSSGNRPIDFLQEQGVAWVNQEETESPGFNVARAGQLLTAIAAANENPRDFGSNSVDLVYELNTYYDPKTAAYGQATSDNVIDQVWAMIGLSSNNIDIPVDAADWLISAEKDDGSWDDGFGSFLDTTPLALLALISSDHAERVSSSIQSGIDFMAQNQQPDGGWQSEWDTSTNANTTGVILQVISLLGQNPSDENWQKTDGNPTTALLAIQQENGVFGFDFGNAYSTADAIVGLSGRNITSLGFLQSSSEAFDYLFAEQMTDGGWGSVGLTLDAMLAMQAAGWDPNSIIVGGAHPLESVEANFESYFEVGPDAIGKTILSLSAAYRDPRQFTGIDLSQKLMETYNENDQAFGDPGNTWHQAFAILGLYTLGHDIPQGAIDTLLDLQQEDGGWEYASGFGSWPDNTALAIQAILAVGLSSEDESIVNALDYIRSNQNADGGWGDSSTTAFVIMALNALEENLSSWQTESGKDPLLNLLSYQKSNGAFVFNWDFPDDNLMSTTAALVALYDGHYLIQPQDISCINQAAIVVDDGSGNVFADCVEFEDDSISGMQLLEVSDFEFDMSEGFLNSIMGIINPEGETNYWSYWSWDGQKWSFKNTGAGESIVNPGTIEGWHLTSWEVFPNSPSRFVPDIDQICNNKVLKSYSEQPFLDYNDLFFTQLEAVNEPEVIEEAPTITSTVPVKTEEESIQDTEVIKTETSEVNKAEDVQSNTAIIIIAAVGVVVLIFTLIYVLRKHK